MLSCFSFQLIDLPVTFVNENADVCLVGVASVLLFFLLPPVLSSKGYTEPIFQGPVDDAGTRRLDQDMSNYEDITELELNTKETSKQAGKWWEEEQVFGLQDYQDYGWYDKLGVDN